MIIQWIQTTSNISIAGDGNKELTADLPISFSTKEFTSVVISRRYGILMSILYDIRTVSKAAFCAYNTWKNTGNTFTGVYGIFVGY